MDFVIFLGGMFVVPAALIVGVVYDVARRADDEAYILIGCLGAMAGSFCGCFVALAMLQAQGVVNSWSLILGVILYGDMGAVVGALIGLGAVKLVLDKRKREEAEED